MLAFKAKVIAIALDEPSGHLRVKVRLGTDSPFMPIELAEMRFYASDAGHLRVNDEVDFTLNLHNPLFDAPQ